MIIGSLDDPGEDRIRAGHTRQRDLLTATAAGLDATLLAPTVEVPAARTLLGGGWWPRLSCASGTPPPASRR
ncbi:hypothetical protein [Amycolatopsis sp. PS_44_ISF1]|uniref:hypothetical protein n=1 Tax=Amycolatopsis sp. PS_44_ISF1 TaxID=2974917 RepID=UPI0028DF2EF4|nr:hypothetical protein [Amycolatopsis sp. PS_44_ISF1]MDT8913643.1 hypothetical protein [Amycolatopsis sp. PS_44_ISF1]